MVRRPQLAAYRIGSCKQVAVYSMKQLAPFAVKASNDPELLRVGNKYNDLLPYITRVWLSVDLVRWLMDFREILAGPDHLAGRKKHPRFVSEIQLWLLRIQRSLWCRVALALCFHITSIRRSYSGGLRAAHRTLSVHTSAARARTGASARASD